MTRTSLLFALALMAACTQLPKVAVVESSDGELKLSPAKFSDLNGWEDDNIAEASQAFKISCNRIVKASPSKKFGPLDAAGTYGDWQTVCKKFLSTANPSRDFFEKNFQPYAVSNSGKTEGLFTGYYEASLRGSLQRSGPYQTPLHSRPDDLVMVNLGEFRDHLKGERIAGRVKGGRLKPYESREEITTGQWPHKDKTLIWVDDPVDAFFVQIQGSGIVELPNGDNMRIGYAGQNGHPYYAIGRELIARGQLTKKTVSLQSIRKWLADNPSEAEQIMNTNKSYVFFRQLKGAGPLGGEGIALTPGRSLAIDRSLLPYGMPVFLNATHPEKGEAPLQRLMIAQDTGGAIRGPVRGDVFWGYGDIAEKYAGQMKSKGRYWILLPK